MPMLLVPPTAAAGSNVLSLFFRIIFARFYILNVTYSFLSLRQESWVLGGRHARFACFLLSDASSAGVGYG